ncbi:hypothetical protein Z946_2329 [Sulfitobacter noctilucicola]|nr:hypothetical protein Z946_2329 [Sulfitobacter noctilucicola]
MGVCHESDPFIFAAPFQIGKGSARDKRGQGRPQIPDACRLLRRMPSKRPLQSNA